MPQPHVKQSSGLFKFLTAMLLLVLLMGGTLAAQSPSGRSDSTSSQAEAAKPARDFLDSRRHVGLELLVGTQTAAPGSVVPLAVIFDHDPGWHIHTSNPVVPKEFGDLTVIKTQITLKPEPNSPLSVDPSKIQWPGVHIVDVDFTGTGVVQYGVYENRAIAYVPVKVAANATPGTYPVTIRVTFQACDDKQCLAPARNIPLQTSITVVGPETALTPITHPDFVGLDQGLLQDKAPKAPTPPAVPIGTPPIPVNANQKTIGAFGLDFDVDLGSGLGVLALLSLAFVGGLLLNFTPCVLPVIPLKIMSIEKHAGSRGRGLFLGVVMAAGVAGFWLAMGIAIAGLSVLTSINQLFQIPLFTVGVGVVIAILAVAMTGLFTINLPVAVYNITPKLDSAPGAFGFGIMTAVLSTPCTGPFMGGAAGASAALGVTLSITVFLTIGLGMASPYLVLSAVPQLAKHMPKSGPGSEALKQVMGILMLAAAAFFIGSGLSGLTFNPPAPASTVYWWAVAALVSIAGLWIIIKTIKLGSSKVGKSILIAIGLAFILAANYSALSLTSPGPIAWVYYMPDKLEQAKAQGKPVMIEFTAEWCINCKVMEKAVLYTDPVVDAINELGVVPIKVDLTGNNDPGNELLNHYGRVAIPFLVVLDKEGKVVFESDAYTAGALIHGLKQAAGK